MQAFARRFGASALVALSAFGALACTGELIDEGGSGPPPSGVGGTISGAGGTSGGTSGGATSSGGSSSGDGGSSTGGAAPCGTAEVRAVFAQSCTGSLCHDASAPAAELDLTVFDPASAMSGVASTLCAGAILVDPGSPSTSLLFVKVDQTMPACGEPMPIGATLDAASIDCIASWITRLETDPPPCETCGGATCTDLLADTANCGECGHACAAGEICVDGACEGCPDGQSSCGTLCVDLMTSADYCGDCATSCGAGQVCVDGGCACAGGASVSFAADVAPLLDGGCTDNGCHGGAMPQEGLELGAAVSYDALVGVVAEQCKDRDGRLLVEAGAPEKSYLVQKLLGTDMCSGSLMPKKASPFTEAQVATISSWICAGALDN